MHISIFHLLKGLIMHGKNFILCGLTGWCIEVAFTSAGSFTQKDKKLTGKTSAWMFPIYGMAATIGVISPKISHWPILFRGLLYGTSIMTAEYITGSILTHFDSCPWSYEGKKYSIDGLVRLDYLPFWMMAGLLYEKLLTSQNPSSPTDTPTRTSA